MRKRPLIAVVLASIALNAALGIYALLVPHFGHLQGQVLATSACVTGAGVLTLACLPALEQRRLRVLPSAGIGASALGFALVVVGVWSEPGSDAFAKAVGTVLVVAGLCVHASLLSLARLARRYRWAFPAAVVLAGLLCSGIVVALWGEPSTVWFARLLGVVAVLLAAVTLSVPIVHRASRGELERADSPPARARFCPSCGASLPSDTGPEAACAACGARFEVRYVPDGGVARRDGAARFARARTVSSRRDPTFSQPQETNGGGAATAVRVLIAGDHALFVDALTLFLSVDGRIEVVGRTPDGLAAVERAVELEPNVVLMDLTMPLLDGLEATRRVLASLPRTSVIVVSGLDRPELPEQARAAGAAGFLMKSEIHLSVVDAILQVAGVEVEPEPEPS